MLARGDMDIHSSLAVKLRRAEKKILHNVVAYSASQKGSAAERCEEFAAQSPGGAAEVWGGSPSFYISSVPTATGEQEFVRINDGVQVYGTDVERAASDVEFFESVRRGDYRTGCSQNSDLPVAVESKIESDLTSLDIRTLSDSSTTPPECLASTAEMDDSSVVTVPANVDSL